MVTRVWLRVSEELFAEIEAARGPVARERWLRSAVLAKLGRPADYEPSAGAPEGHRSSSDAKDGVSPRPKGS